MEEVAKNDKKEAEGKKCATSLKVAKQLTLTHHLVAELALCTTKRASTTGLSQFLWGAGM